ncbi:MAG: methylmalonyl-CoA mutase [Thermoplasmata archaeon]
MRKKEVRHDTLGKKISDWETTTLRKSLDALPERSKEFQTLSSIPAKRVYTPADIRNLDYLADVGFPGEFPFTRGIHPTMYRGRLWTMRQYAGFGSARESNERYKFLISQGQTGLSVAFDLPTQMGYDSDHPMARGEVGKVGVAISSLKDMEVLFDGILLDEISTSMTINSTAPILLAMYIAVAQEQGLDARGLRGTVQNDVLKEYIARGTYIFPPKESMKLTVDLIEFCSKGMPSWNPVSISGYHMREAGATADQELAFTFANAIAYIENVLERGLKVDDFASRLSFFFCAQSDFLEEVAKFRAARRLWARIMKERFEAKEKRSMVLRFHTQTSGVSLSAQEPENNVIRVTLQALAAVLGGTQSLHTNSMDEALALPSEKAVKLALRTQQIIAHESGAASTADPLAGSYCIEWLTSEIEERVRKYIEEIDSMGGAIQAIDKGYPQREIAESAYRFQKEVEEDRRFIIGVNIHRADEKSIEGMRVDPEIEKDQMESIRRLKRERNEGRVRESLVFLEKVTEKGENLMSPILRCVRNYATLGEISDVLRGFFGEYEVTDFT